MDLGQRIVIILFIFLAIWYLIGSIINRRLGVSVFEWLRAGLEQIGKISEARWIGSSGSGARLVVSQASAPFHRMEVVYLMESREILPLWLFNRIRGKRDEMVIRANLRIAPAQELEAARHSSREFQKTLSNPETKSFEQLPDHAGFELARRGRNDIEAFDKFKELLNKYQDAITQFSLQRQAPHLILRAIIPPLRANSSGVFFEDIRKLFE